VSWPEEKIRFLRVIDPTFRGVKRAGNIKPVYGYQLTPVGIKFD